MPVVVDNQTAPYNYYDNVPWQRIATAMTFTFSGIIDGTVAGHQESAWSQLNGTWHLKRSSRCCFSCKGPIINGQPTTIEFCYTPVTQFDVPGELSPNTPYYGVISPCTGAKYYLGLWFADTISVYDDTGLVASVGLTYNSLSLQTLRILHPYDGSMDQSQSVITGNVAARNGAPIINGSYVEGTQPCGQPFSLWVANGTADDVANNCGCAPMCQTYATDPVYVDFNGAAIPGGTTSFGTICQLFVGTPWQGALPAATLWSSGPCTFHYSSGLWISNNSGQFFSPNATVYNAGVTTPKGSAPLLFFTGNTISTDSDYPCTWSGSWTAPLPDNCCGKTITLTSAPVILDGYNITPQPITLTFP